MDAMQMRPTTTGCPCAYVPDSGRIQPHVEDTLYTVYTFLHTFLLSIARGDKGNGGVARDFYLIDKAKSPQKWAEALSSHHLVFFLFPFLASSSLSSPNLFLPYVFQRLFGFTLLPITD